MPDYQTRDAGLPDTGCRTITRRMTDYQTPDDRLPDTGLPDTDVGLPEIKCGKLSDSAASSFSNEQHVRVQLKRDGTR